MYAYFAINKKYIVSMHYCSSLTESSNFKFRSKPFSNQSLYFHSTFS